VGIRLSETATILHWLIWRCYNELAKALLLGSSKTEQPGIFTYTTRQRSAMSFDINASCGEQCGSALKAAVDEARSEFVKLLLTYGAEAVPTRLDVPYPLMVAVRRGRCDVITLLIQHGLDVNIITDDFRYTRGQAAGQVSTPLILASIENCSRVVRLLLAHGADIH
jgi:ankyrin repeat protein